MLNDSMVGELRSQHLKFTYQSSNWNVADGFLHLRWKFFTEPDLEFSPTMLIPLPADDWQQRVQTQVIDQLVFHIGMVEMLSYWKATASPHIHVAAGSLNESQIEWWHNLLLKGMGEYFFVNQINFKQPDFLRITSDTLLKMHAEPPSGSLHKSREGVPRLLVPIGGGKDSLVTLELLRQWRQQQAEPMNSDSIAVFGLNPTIAAATILETCGFHHFAATRTIDPRLLDCNKKGFLNGHTPFSALLSFVALLVAVVHDYDAVVLSNEQSANEANLSFLGEHINHQYSKSLAYEQSFRSYVSTFLQPITTQSLPEYYSLLRPLNELQIAKLFSEIAETYFAEFRSCNRGQKENRWCGSCAKCLFAFAMLFPFLGESQLTSIFGSNLFENQELEPYALQLIGKSDHKPLDCVGTYAESLAAFSESYRWYLNQQQPPPILLERLSQNNHLLSGDTLHSQWQKLLQEFNSNHCLPKNLELFLTTNVF